ncbi:MAG TPA: TetR/AcrR family transcriptional regulator [Acidobacteriaceae bacterium]|jgi:AcrR family transcriptional regulator|nr:TetR/AcrR family transcriptional regulator [Acidobacteriaceae bacterium]
MKKTTLKKSEETRTRILDAALNLFRERGFEGTTMREVAQSAGVAVGAAYYYFDSKDAIVLAFYERTQAEMLSSIADALDRARTLEARLRAVISAKFEYFRPNRRLLAALSAHTDPGHPLSPFGRETRAIRDADTALFERAATDSGVKLPPSIRPYLARLLWMYQMGLILFWVYDNSLSQKRTELLYDKTLKMLLFTLKIAGTPLLRPLHRFAGELLAVIYD